jgi:spore germination protein
MKMLRKVICIILLFSLLLTGCWDQQIFEQIGFNLSFAMELAEDGELLITTAYPVIGGGEKGTVDIISTKSSIVRGGRTNFRMESPRFNQGGKVQQILLSEELAKNGIHDLLELFQRDATVPAISYVVIVEGSPSELLKKASTFKSKPRVSFYLFQLLENNVKTSTIPNTKVFDFDINYFAKGLDPIVPVITLGTDVIKITGCALFNNDIMTGKLDNLESSLLLGMMNQMTYTDMILKLPEFSSKHDEKFGLAVTLFKKSRKISIDFTEDGIPVVDIKVKYNCNIDEYKWDKTMDPNIQKNMEKAIADYFTEINNKVIKKLQEANCDPIGIGDTIRAKYNEYWKTYDWKKVYPEAQISSSAEVEILTVGIIK